MFGRTYVCEQFLSSMKINKSALRSRLTSKYVNATLRVANIRNFKTNVDFLASAKRCQISGQNLLEMEKIVSSEL